MEASFMVSGNRPYIENAEPGEYGLPSPKERRGLFWQLAGPLVGLRQEHHPRPGSLDWQLDAIARRDQRIVEANKPPSIASEIVVELVGHVKEVVKKLRKPTELQRARTWLQETLAGEPMLATTVEKLAVKAGISKRTLRRAAKSAKVRSRRKGRGPWVWSLVQAETQEGQQG
jgi:hypothetical protein